MCYTSLKLYTRQYIRFQMKVVSTMVCFICFLLIRSGNSHIVLNESDRPAVSLMYLYNDASLKEKVVPAGEAHLGGGRK